MLLDFNENKNENGKFPISISDLSREDLEKLADTFMVYRVPGESDDMYYERIKGIFTLASKVEEVFTREGSRSLDALEVLTMLLSKSVALFDDDFLDTWCEKIKTLAKIIKDIPRD